MKIWRLAAFPKTPKGGNKAGVVLDADKLSEQEMQDIAKDVGYSETAFVSKSEHADFKVRFFTPTDEVDLCGHATIATFNLLRDLGKITPGFYTQETKAGILQLDVQEDMVFMEQNNPSFYETILPEELASCFDLEDCINIRYPIKVVSTGIKEIFVPVQSVDHLNKLVPNMTEITRISNKYGTIGMHLFALDREVDAYGRNFAPIVGIDEESATGTSNGALSCYLYKYVEQNEQWVLRQGYSMNQPSEIYSALEITNNTITSVWVGGTATIIDEG